MKQLLLLTAFLLTVSSAAQATPKDSFMSGGCFRCHAGVSETPPLIQGAPNVKAIAEKYKMEKSDVQADVLTKKIRKGTSGSFGKMPMPPILDKQLSEKDTTIVVKWVLDTYKK